MLLALTVAAATLIPVVVSVASLFVNSGVDLAVVSAAGLLDKEHASGFGPMRTKQRIAQPNPLADLKKNQESSFKVVFTSGLADLNANRSHNTKSWSTRIPKQWFGFFSEDLCHIFARQRAQEAKEIYTSAGALKGI